MLKIYGTQLCPDCVKCTEELDAACVAYEYLDVSQSLLSLKEFLKLRDENPIFDPVRQAGKIGIPCIVRDDGSLTLDWDEFLK